jgi:MAF protein
LLHLLGLPFEVTAADVAEVPQADETPVELVTRLSRAKAENAKIGDAKLNSHGKALVIACDTVVAMEEADGGTRILGKPRDAEEAVDMLRLLRGRSHLVYSAVTALERGQRTATELAKTHLTMRAYTDSEIAAYVASGDPLDKAGAYAIQHQGFHPVKEIEGCYASVMGLPLCHLTRLLLRWGYPPAADVPAACEAHTGHRCEAVYQEIKGS